ncbi:MAG: rod shape-determining protein MreC [Thermoleophilaceae bacterium]|jgi:rod shape-determining protein MreC|nr:rod shape-determining protein MreC [Thermoleophilaceae bacterium]
MFSRSPVQRRRAVLAALLAVSLVLLTVYFSEPVSGGLHAIQRGAGEVLSPLEAGATRIFKPFSDLAGWVSDVASAKKQNKQLKAEVKNLHGELATLATNKREADQLRALAQVSANLPQNAKTVTARVIAHSPTVWYSTVDIDKGRNDGVRVNQPVITAGGLAGTVVSTTGGNARVALITDSSSAVAAEVMPTGVHGVVKPEIGGKDLILDYIPKNSHVRSGQVVITSGFKSGELQSLFPRGIAIGTVGSVNADQLQIYQRVRVHPYAQLREIDFVQVVTNNGTTSSAAVAQP